MYPPSKKYSYCKYMYMYTKTLKNIAIQIMRITMTEKGSKFTYAHYLTMLHIMSDRVHIKYTK